MTLVIGFQGTSSIIPWVLFDSSEFLTSGLEVTFVSWPIVPVLIYWGLQYRGHVYLKNTWEASRSWFCWLWNILASVAPFFFPKEMTHSCGWASQLPCWHSFLLNEHLPCYLTEHGLPAALFKKQVPFLFTWRQFPPTAQQWAFSWVLNDCAGPWSPSGSVNCGSAAEATLTTATCGCPPTPAVPSCSCSNLWQRTKERNFYTYQVFQRWLEY